MRLRRKTLNDCRKKTDRVGKGAMSGWFKPGAKEARLPSPEGAKRWAEAPDNQRSRWQACLAPATRSGQEPAFPPPSCVV